MSLIKQVTKPAKRAALTDTDGDLKPHHWILEA